MDEMHELIQTTIASRVSPEARVIAVRQREGGEQGFSQVTLRYYDVAYERAGTRSEINLVVKEVAPVERHTLRWLGDRGLPVPFNRALDAEREGLTPLCMQYVDGMPTSSVRAQDVARALAAIHLTALGRRDELPWLPRADPGFFAERIVDTCWRRAWHHALTGEGYTDWYGRRRESRAPDPFWAQFAAYERPLEEAAARFVRDMAALWQEADALTVWLITRIGSSAISLHRGSEWGEHFVKWPLPSLRRCLTAPIRLPVGKAAADAARLRKSREFAGQ